jgi:hypothetical protein
MKTIPNTTPPMAPSIVFFGLIDGASWSPPERATGVVLSRVAHGDRVPISRSVGTPPAIRVTRHQHTERQPT